MAFKLPPRDWSKVISCFDCMWATILIEEEPSAQRGYLYFEECNCLDVARELVDYCLTRYTEGFCRLPHKCGHYLPRVKECVFKRAGNCEMCWNLECKVRS